MAGHFKFLAFVLAIGVSAQAFGVVQPTTYEDFTTDSDTRWTGVNNRPPGVPPNSNNYGWSNTDDTGTAVNAPTHAASGAGELGTLVARGNESNYGFNTGAMLPTDVLHADGVIRNLNGSGNWFFGFYNAASHISAGGDPRNFIGIQMDDNQKALYHNARSDHNDRTHNGPAVVSSGTTVQWSMDYNGAGQTTFKIGSDPIIVLNSGGGYFTGGGGPATVFDRFGLFPGNTSGGLSDFRMDDITFSSTNPIPEPASLGLLSLGGLALIRRRRA